MEDATIIKLFEIQKSDLKEIIEDNGVAIRGVIRSEVDRIDELDRKRNGRIADNEKLIKENTASIVELEKKDISFESYQTNCPANRMASKWSKPRTWVLSLVVVTAIYFILSTLYHEFGAGEFLRLVLNII